jgi:SAM-dependent methyltransferase
VLDIGCGDGLFFDQLATFGSSVQGIEPAGDLVSDDPGRRSRIFIGPFDETYRPERSFQLIVMLDVLEHLDDPVGALRHALSLLEPGGVFLATVPAFESLWTTHDELNEHRVRYTKRSFRQLADVAGLEIDRLEYFFHWTYPIKRAQHLLERLTRPRPTPTRVPWAPLNATLRTFSRIERSVTETWNLPFGSSLLAVGHARAPSGDADAGRHPDRSSTRDG